MKTRFQKDIYSFHQASADIDRFEEFLKKFGIKIESGSELERLVLDVHDVLYKHTFPSTQDSNVDIRAWLTDVIGMNHLIQRILLIGSHPEIQQIVKHLELLNDCTPLQNSPTIVTDQKSNKVFELLIACSVMQFAVKIELDDPENSKGDNPDIIADFSETKWGIACKVAHALKGKTIFENITKGIEQIELSEAETGVVVINLKNIIKHQSYWRILNEDDWKTNRAEPIFSASKDHEEAVSLLLAEVKDIERLIIKDIGVDQIKIAFENRKTVPAIGFYVHTTVGVAVDSTPIPTSIGFLKLWSFGNLTDREMEFLAAMNNGLQLASIDSSDENNSS